MAAPVQLERFSGNPILSPHPDHPWEDLAVFNPAAWRDEATGEVLLLYRTAESGPEYKCWFGLARSRDGYHFERVSDRPVLSPSGEGFDGATIQDPRMIRMGEWCYVTYACRHFPFGQFWVCVEGDRPPAKCDIDLMCVFHRHLKLLLCQTRFDWFLWVAQAAGLCMPRRAAWATTIHKSL